MLPESIRRGRDGAMLLLLTAWALCSSATARQLSEREYHEMPRLYHLDDFDRCLSRPNALYCTGTFQLSADKPSRIYNLIQDHSAEKMNFNRMLLYRGSCVSERCPSLEINSTWRFERCIQQQIPVLGMTATLLDHYCHFATTTLLKLDYHKLTFLAVVVIILWLNFFGTMYDFATESNGKRKLLLAWSIRGNWRRLITSYEDSGLLSPVNGFRVVSMFFMMVAHVFGILHGLYLYNPNHFEKVFNSPFAVIFKNATGGIQLFIVIGSYLFGYNLLLRSKKVPLGLSKFPRLIANRIFRLVPVHMLVVGFSATWWQQLGSGPQWMSIVGAEAAVCRRKLPLHAAFVHNLVQPADHCLLPTWYIAVDFQLCVVASCVMLVLMQLKWRPLTILIVLFIFSCIANVILIHYYQWKSMLYFIAPETVKTYFHDEPSFSRFYTAPWGSLPCAFLGLLTAQLQFQIQETGYKIAKCKLFVWLYHMTFPLTFVLVLSGSILLKHTSSTFITAYTGVERPLFGLLCALLLLGFANNIDGTVRRVLSWRGFSVMGRLSLSVLVLHWCVIKTFVATRRTLTDVSFVQLTLDSVGSWAWTYMLAIPVTVLVEYPFLRMGKVLFSLSD